MPRLKNPNAPRPVIEPKYLPFGEWCRRNGIAPSTGKLMIRNGEVRVIRAHGDRLPADLQDALIAKPKTPA